METLLNKLTARPVYDDLYDYQLAANTTEALKQKILCEKTDLTFSNGQKPTIKSEFHISIATFKAKEAMEETLIRYIQRICRGQTAFEAAVNNYSGYPTGKIYLRIQDPTPFQSLGHEFRLLNNYISSCSCPTIQVVSHPYLTITQDIPESDYFKVMMEFSQRTFHETFFVSELVLLRKTNVYNEAKTINIFHLAPMSTY